MGRFLRGKRVIAAIMALVIMFLACGLAPDNSAQAAAYITREAFVTLVMKKLGFTVKASDSYIDAAIRARIISKSTFGTKTSSNLTKSDAAVVLTNAHEFLYGQTVEDSLLAEIKEKRISDIAKVSKARQPYVVKAYAYGYLKGTSNGAYSKNRKFGPNGKITVATAKTLVSMLKDESKRSKISPDGQLIRTTNLPEFAEFYPYILASFPNDYYDWEFMFMRYEGDNGPLYGSEYFVNLKDYAAPIDFIKYRGSEKIWQTYLSNRYYLNSEQYYQKFAEKWEENVIKHLELIFNVDYRKLAQNNEWYNNVIQTDCYYGADRRDTEDEINRYIKKAINNKTIIESRIIGVDKSSLYVDYTGGCIRAYVEFRIISSNAIDRDGCSSIVFTRYMAPNIQNIKLGEWRKCYLDVSVNAAYESCGIYETIINDYYHDHRLVIVDEK